jgi:predicted metal-dependent hydrolase
MPQLSTRIGGEMLQNRGPDSSYDGGVQLRLPWPSGKAPAAPAPHRLLVDGEPVPVTLVRHRRARRYVLRVWSDGTLRLTVPRSGSIAGALRFAEGQRPWIIRERERQRERARPWDTGTVMWFRGEQVSLARLGTTVTFGAERLSISDVPADVRPAIEARLRDLADRELPARCLQFAASRDLQVARVAVRNHRSRWGACSARGVITLNWRLIHMPPLVSDYILWHELTHLAHPNHSSRFWRAVERVCPTWKDAERWLRRHGREIL